MRFNCLAAALILSFLGIYSASLFAEDNNSNSMQSFQSICLDSWMKRVNNANQDSYKRFGEKYCACAQTQPLDSDEAVDKAIQVCMSRTLLHESLASLDTKTGLKKASETEIVQACEEKWNLIYPQLSEENKKTAVNFCECSKNKLISFIKKLENSKKQDFNEQIGTVATSCANEIKPSSSTSEE